MSSDSNSPTDSLVNYEENDIPIVDGTKDSPVDNNQPLTENVEGLVDTKTLPEDTSNVNQKQKEGEDTAEDHKQETTESAVEVTLTTERWYNTPPSMSRKTVAYLTGAVAVVLAGVFALKRFR